MSTQKSHFAYRLAWENTTSERIPYLPLHRRDLVSAEEGNRTYNDEGDGRINWKKFQIIGDVVIGIQKSQGTPYPHILCNMEIQCLVLDGKFCKEEEVSGVGFVEIMFPICEIRTLHFLHILVQILTVKF